jgi:hypothetical protein
MRRGLLPLTLHAAIEPVAAAILIASSWIFGFSDNSRAQTATIVLGAIMLASGAMTNWRPSLVKLLPLAVHFILDVVLAFTLVVAPFVWGFRTDGAALRFTVIFGVVELLTALITRWEGEDQPLHGGTFAPRTT